MRRQKCPSLAFAAVFAASIVAGAPVSGLETDKFTVQRKEVFEFTEKPTVTRDGDKVTIRFAVKDYCDATVAIEDAAGKIVRHLASGVLGDNAPEPFQKSSLKQTVVWDGKDDKGAYVDDKDALTVRVSLGLKAQFERTLFWSPEKRISTRMPLVAAAEEGVYVYDGNVVDHIRLFDHAGQYVRTVYPFPAGEVGERKGVKTQAFPQDGRTLPLKVGFFQATLLTSGPNAGPEHADGQPGQAGRVMAVHKGNIALMESVLNRIAVKGRADVGALTGPRVAVNVGGSPPVELSPTSAAFSPDGRRLYLTGYTWKRPNSYLATFATLPAVLRLEYASDREPEVFLGGLRLADQGNDNEHLNTPSSVACDAAGRVYVSDYVNDRVQVFSAEGKHLETIATSKPAQVCIHHKTQEIYVFSWAVPSYQTLTVSVKPAVTRFGRFEDPRKIDSFPLPVPFYEEKISEWYGGSHLGYGHGQPVLVTLDSWAEPPVIWLARERAMAGLGCTWETMGVRLLAVEKGQLKEIGDFAQDAAKSVVRLTPATFQRQRLYVNPKDGALYVGEDRGYSKSVAELVKIDPATGKVRLAPVPFSAEDFAFDIDGYVYLRTNTRLARYDPVTWREVPFDYGIECPDCGFTADGMGLKTAAVTSVVDMPAPYGWHHGGLAVSALGHIAVSCYNKGPARLRTDPKAVYVVDKYVPTLYPGRTRMGEVHVWDSRGKLLKEDAVPGIAMLNGVGIDRDDNLYLLAARNRVLDGRAYWNPMAGTLLKVRSGKAKVLSTAGATIPLPDAAKPDRPVEFVNGPHGQGWVNGAEWMYGGVGFGGKNLGTGCACWNCRSALDYFGRSFAPEIDHYSVAVLDTNGNLLFRVGKYGNVDDGKPLDARGGPPGPRPMGGDEVSLFHACYLATETDRRLFIADAGNARILSVRLDYHATESVALRNVADSGKK